MKALIRSLVLVALISAAFVVKPVNAESPADANPCLVASTAGCTYGLPTVQYELLLTQMTPTGRETAQQLFGALATIVYLPYDYPFAVQRFLRHFRPRVGVLLETEVWFNLIQACHAASLPLLLLNAPKLVAHRNWDPPFGGGTHSPLPLPDRHLLVIADEATSPNCRDGLRYVWVFDVRAPENPISIATCPTPSEADIKVTRDLIRAGQLLKIELLDHVILGRRMADRPKDYASLRELGYFYN